GPHRPRVQTPVAAEAVAGVFPKPIRPLDAEEVGARPGLRLLRQKGPLARPDLQLDRMVIAEELAPNQGLGQRLHVQPDGLDDQIPIRLHWGIVAGRRRNAEPGARSQKPEWIKK